MNKKKKNNKGFTLVELIIVMAIMAILIGAIVPQIFAYVEESKAAKDLQLCNTVFTAVQTGIATQGDQTSITKAEISTLFTSYPKIKTLLGSDLETSDLIIAKTVSKPVVKSGSDKWEVYVNFTSGHLEVYFAADGSATTRISVSN